MIAFKHFEIALWLTTLLLTTAWIIWPDYPLEPYTLFSSLCATYASFKNRSLKNSTTETIDTPHPYDRAERIKEPRNTEAEKLLPRFNYGNSCDFFSERFSHTFPGLRKPTWFHKKQAVDRLCLLLKAPLRFSQGKNNYLEPIWWLGYGNSSIRCFSIIDRETVLMNADEIKIEKICACYLPNYKQKFVYVECSPLPSTGLYDRDQDYCEMLIKERGRITEEYGVFKGSHIISREEYDDGAAIVLGSPVKLNGEAELRVRYVSPYNFLICAAGTSINAVSFDHQLRDHLRAIQINENCIHELINIVKELPNKQDIN